LSRRATPPVTPEELVRATADRYDESGRLAEEALRKLAYRLARSGKTCSSCGATKILGAFGRDSTRSDGLKIACRDCRRTPRRDDNGV
jgi:hypothetical protein